MKDNQFSKAERLTVEMALIGSQLDVKKEIRQIISLKRDC